MGDKLITKILDSIDTIKREFPIVMLEVDVRASHDNAIQNWLVEFDELLFERRCDVINHSPKRLSETLTGCVGTHLIAGNTMEETHG